MIKKILIFISLISVDVSAMQWCKNGYFSDFSTFLALIVSGASQTSKKKFPNNGICWLELLPPEIQDHIASYLVFSDRETDQEFIKRTLGITLIQVCGVSTRYKYLNSIIKIKRSGLFFALSIIHKKTRKERSICSYFCSSEFAPRRISDSLVACSPDCSKVIYSPDADRELPQKLHLFDIYKNTQSKYYFGNRDDRKIRYVNNAISSDGKILTSLLHGFGDSSPFPARNSGLHISDISDVTKNILELSDEEIAKCKLITINNPNIVTFNKQGTKVIVRSNYEYEIFDLCDEAEHNQKSRKTLADYFRQRGICKNLLCRTESEDNL